MPHPPRPLPVGLDAEFSTAQAAQEGVTRARLRARDLTSPFHGARRRKDVDAHAEAEEVTDAGAYAQRRAQRRRVLNDMRAYATVMPEESFFCGRTAAVAYDAWVDHPGDLEVAVFSPRRAPRAAGVRGRKVAQHLAATTTHESLLLSTPASTWAMLARDVTLRELVAIGDAFVQVPRDEYGRRHPDQALATLADLRAAVDAGPRPGSTASMGAALDLIRVGSSSPLETDFPLDAEAAGLPAPELDLEIRGPNGELLGISEFVFRQYRVVVEVEGDHHRTERRQWLRDIEKYHTYAAAGLEVVRLTSAHIRGRHPSAVSIVTSALRRHGWDG